MFEKSEARIESSIRNQENFLIEFIINDITSWQTRKKEEAFLHNFAVKAVSIASFSLHNAPKSHVKALEQVLSQFSIRHYLTSLTLSALK